MSELELHEILKSIEAKLISIDRVLCKGLSVDRRAIEGDCLPATLTTLDVAHAHQHWHPWPQHRITSTQR